MPRWRIFSQCQTDGAKQEQIIAHKGICDMFLSVLATAENIVKLPIDEKKYAYYDEYNSSKYKTYNGLMLQLLRIMEYVEKSIEIYIKKYKSFEFPEKINLNIVLNKIIYWKSLNEDKYFHLYLDELINIIIGKPQLNLEEYKTQYYSNKPTNETNNIKRNDMIIRAKCNISKEDQKTIEQIEKTGNYEYVPVYNGVSGRLDNGKTEFIKESIDDNTEEDYK